MIIELLQFTAFIWLFGWFMYCFFVFADSHPEHNNLKLKLTACLGLIFWPILLPAYLIWGNRIEEWIQANKIKDDTIDYDNTSSTRNISKRS